jgi:hypothetical protein
MLNLYSTPSHIEAPDFGKYFGRDGLGYQAYAEAEQAYIDALKAWAKKLAPASPIAGELVSMPYADGAALYIIVQSSGKHGLMPVPVGDAWRDPNFEQYATVAALKDMVARNRRFEKARARV